MNIENINLIIGIIGCITGCLGFCISLTLFFKERTVLKIQFLNKAYWTLAKTDDNYDNDYGDIIYNYNEDDCFLALKIRISNNSKNPTSIYSFSLNKKYLYDSSSDFKENHLFLSFGKNDKYLNSLDRVCLDLGILNPIITLSPYQSIDGYIFFNHLYPECFSKPLKLFIHSTQTRKKVIIKPNYTKYSIVE